MAPPLPNPQHHQSPAAPARSTLKPNYGTVPAHQHTYAPAHVDEEAAAAVPVSALDAAAAAAALQIDAAGRTTTTPKRCWVPGWAYLVVFVLLYSANNAVLAGLMAKGYPYTICNIMCVGNFIGILTLFPVFHHQLTLTNLRQVTLSQWGWMLLGCLLANVLGSVAYLQGLRLTSVPARAMTGRLESVDFLAASAWFLGDRYGGWVQVNALLTVLGVVTAVVFPILVQHHPMEGKIGYVYLVLGGWGYTLSLLITKKYLVHLPVGVLSFFKLSLGTILFHFLSVWQHGQMDMPSMTSSSSSSSFYYPPALLRTMLWYAPLFVTSTQVLWLRALKLCSPSVLSIGMNANFVVTVLMGGVILGKWPTVGEMVGGGFILVSIVSGIAETVLDGRRKEVEEEARREGRRERRRNRRRRKDKAIGDEEVGGKQEEGEEGEEGLSSGDRSEEEGEETLLLRKAHFQASHIEQDSLSVGFGPHVIM